MTVLGIDDTDSREKGMCTTYLAARIADRLALDYSVERRLLVRLNPAVEHKTRGNAALAIHTDASVNAIVSAVRAEFSRAKTADPQTNPGVVIAPEAAETIPDLVAEFARHAVTDYHAISDARETIDRLGYETLMRGNGRGLIGALAAVGAWRAFDEWTYEYISYRELGRRGSPRDIDHASVMRAADEGYPDAWDTVDRGEDQLVCIPHTPGPILHGIRGDDPDVVQTVAESIESEPVERRSLFRTNQGTDAHIRTGKIGHLEDGRAYRVTGVVHSPPETREGGHVFVTLRPVEANAVSANTAKLSCVAFEPTKRFRDRVRALRPGDRITACGEVSDGTLKLEKFAVRDLVRTQSVTPTCPDCGRSMESAGREQGYRCRACSTTAPAKVERALDRDLAVGWYEVPPCARRHIAKPLVRGGFDAPIHPER